MTLDLYPDEGVKIAAVWDRLERQFEFTSGSETDRKIFDMAAHNEFGEIGISIEITWGEVYEDGLPTGIFMPHVEMVGRTARSQEHDHDRHKWGVVKGLADGKPGYLDVNTGELKEEPKKKNIY